MRNRLDPALTMAYMYPGLIYPGHALDPYSTDMINSSYPEHHYPLEQTRTRVAEAFHHHYDQQIRKPRVDIRETPAKFYVDVELPGLASKEGLKLTWINSRTILVEAHLTRPWIEEEEAAQVESLAAKETVMKENGTVEKQSEKPSSASHLIVRERQLGTYSRAFDFPVSIEKDKLDAKLASGLLRIVVTKTEPQEAVHAKIDIVYGDVIGVASPVSQV
jgi:HSP20 family molecular chaperone IbpA